jgi:hypothetical protein
MAVAHLEINGQRIEATQFAWDGCHKIYLIDSPASRAEIKGCGYNDEDIYSISLLPQIWKDSCGLRFISWADLRRPEVVSQCDPEPLLEWFTR